MMRTVHESVFKPKLEAETRFIVDIRNVNHNAAALCATGNAIANVNTSRLPLEVNETKHNRLGGGVDVLYAGGAHRGDLNANNQRNHKADVNWRRIFTAASLIVSLLLISGSIYLHLRQKSHLGRLHVGQPISAVREVAAATLVATTPIPLPPPLPPTSTSSPTFKTQLNSSLTQSSASRTLIRNDFTQPKVDENAVSSGKQTLALLQANKENNNDDIISRDNNGQTMATFMAGNKTAANDYTVHTPAPAPMALGVSTLQAAAISGHSLTTNVASTTMPSIDAQAKWYAAPSAFDSNRSRHITEACMQCICETTTECRPATCGHNEDCGVFRISRSYWLDAGKPALEGDESNTSNTTTTYAHCVNNLYCATRTVAAYINKYPTDCNGDGVIECRDHIALHLFGPRGCVKFEGKLTTTFMRRMNDCFAKQYK